MIGKKCISLILLILNLSFPIYAKDIPFTDENCIRACIGEASGEGYQGLLAVACAIRNRGTLKGVYGVNAKHVDKEPKWVWDRARKAWEESANKDITNGATHWESTNFKVPYWAKNMEITLKLGKHIFYK